MSSDHPLGLAGHVRACLFDLDGVLTKTAKVHAAAWKEMFDGFLEARSVAAQWHGKMIVDRKGVKIRKRQGIDNWPRDLRAAIHHGRTSSFPPLKRRAEPEC